MTLDSGQRSGGGGVVVQFYYICSKIWSGSPAAEVVEGATDSSSIATNTPTEAMSTKTGFESQVENDATSNNESEGRQVPEHHRRDLVKFLQGCRNFKLKKNFPVDKPILNITKKDID